MNLVIISIRRKLKLNQISGRRRCHRLDNTAGDAAVAPSPRRLWVILEEPPSKACSGTTISALVKPIMPGCIRAPHNIHPGWAVAKLDAVQPKTCAAVGRRTQRISH